MSIQNVTSTWTSPQSRQTASRNRAAGTSFLDQMVQTASTAAPGRAVPDHSSFRKDDLLSAMTDFRSTLLDYMERSKEKTKEQEAWDKLMKYLDTWIESLREGTADIEKTAKAYAALQDELKDNDDRPDLGDRLLQMLQ